MLVNSEGIVLREIRFEETDKILTIFSRRNGKVHAMAKGSLRPRSPLLACSQTFVYSNFCFFKGKNFYHINQGDIINSYYPIRENLNRLFYGAYLLELIDSVIVEEEPNENLFKLLSKGLNVLSYLDDDFLKFIIAFELKYISFAGYRPVLDRCVICNSKLSEDNKFSFREGGVLCHKCFEKDYMAQGISIKNIMNMKLLLFTPLDKLDTLNIPKDATFKIHDLLVKYILISIDKTRFKSLDYIKTLDNYGGWR